MTAWVGETDSSSGTAYSMKLEGAAWPAMVTFTAARPNSGGASQCRRLPLMWLMLAQGRSATVTCTADNGTPNTESERGRPSADPCTAIRCPKMDTPRLGDRDEMEGGVYAT